MRAERTAPAEAPVAGASAAPVAAAADGLPLPLLRRLSAPTLLALSAVLFGAMAVATRAVSGELGAPQIAMVRFLVGLAGVAAVVAGGFGRVHATRPGLLLLRGLFGGLAVLGYFVALERLSAGLGTLLNNTFPLWAAIFGVLFLRERVGFRLAAGLLLAMGGVAVIVGPADLVRLAEGLADESWRIGLLAGLFSGVTGGAATVVIRVLRRTDSSLAVFSAFCLGGALVCLPGALADWRPVSPTAAALLLLVGLFSFAAQLLFTYSLRFVTAGGGSLTTQLTVVASFAFAALFLGEPVSLRAAAGALVVMAGIGLASLQPPAR